MIGFAGDLGMAAAIEDLVRRHPEVDILVNNLGIFEPKPFEDIPDADWMRFFEVNVPERGAPLPRLFAGDEAGELGADHFHLERERAADPGGDDPLRRDEDGADRSRAGPGRTLAGTGITVNSVLPGPTRSRGVTISSPRSARAQASRLSRLSSSRSFVRLRFSGASRRRRRSPRSSPILASPLSSAITGAALRVDGGVVKRLLTREEHP